MLREQKLRKFNSKDFASDEKNIENEIVNYSVSHKKRQTCVIEKKGKLQHMVVNSRLRARTVDGKKNYLFQIIRNSSCQRIFTKLKITKNFLQLSIIEDSLEIIPKNYQHQNTELT